LAINQINLPQGESIFPVMVIDERSPCPYLDPQAFPFYFVSLSCQGGEVREQLGGHSAASQDQPTTVRHSGYRLKSHPLAAGLHVCLEISVKHLLFANR